MANILLINSILKKWSGCFEKGLAIGIIELSYHDFLIPPAHILFPSVYRTKKKPGYLELISKSFICLTPGCFWQVASGLKRIRYVSQYRRGYRSLSFIFHLCRLN